MNFRVGQKVVCVQGDQDLLIKGKLYTIRQIGLRAWTDGSPAVRLEEIVRGPVDSEDGNPLSDTPYYARRFRPIVERKTDISVFTAMLKPSRAKEPALACRQREGTP